MIAIVPYSPPGGRGNTTSHLVIEYLHMIDKTIDHNTTTKSGRGIVLVLNFSILSIIVSGHVSKIRKTKINFPRPFAVFSIRQYIICDIKLQFENTDDSLANIPKVYFAHTADGVVL